MRARATGNKKGNIKAIDASLLIDFPPNKVYGNEVDLSVFYEPIFSPSPHLGGQFPRDICGFLYAFVPISYDDTCDSCPYIGIKEGFPKVPRVRTLFVDQIITDAKTKHGDSGASLFSEDLKLIGLHFAGSGKFSFCNTVENVLYAMKNCLFGSWLI